MGGLGADFFDALDLAGHHVRASGQADGAAAQRSTLVMEGLAEGKRLADGDPFRILGLFGRADPAGVVAGHHACLW
jgi:hypothetical protein